MAGKKENLKALFTNTRTRVIIIFTIVILLVAVTIGLTKIFSSSGDGALTSGVSVSPNIQSIPGALNPTAQYAKLQETQNSDQAQSALKTGASAIPTIIRSQTIGQGVGSVGVNDGVSGVGFSTLTRLEGEGTQRSSWIQELQATNCSKASVNSVLSKGAQFTDLKAGCSCVQLKDLGYTLSQLQPVCNCGDLKKAGFTASQLKSIGYTASRLRLCGFSACELRAAGFTAEQMREGGYSDDELKGAGFPATDDSDIRKAGCTKEGLIKLKALGVSAATIRKINACSADQLKAAGFTDQDLKDAGFTVAEINKNPLDENCSAESLKKAYAAGISASNLRQTRGCSAAALKQAGYSAAALKTAGFTASELKQAGFSAAELKDAGFSAQDLSNTGFSADDLKKEGFTPAELTAAGLVTEVAPLQQVVLPQSVSNVTPIPSYAGVNNNDKVSEADKNAQRLQEILARQNQQISDQKYQQKIQQRNSEMLASANMSMQNWKKAPTQAYVGGNAEKNDKNNGSQNNTINGGDNQNVAIDNNPNNNMPAPKAIFKSGDIIFAVIDTSVNSDEPGPILATIISGRFKGAKLIGSFNLPQNAQKMIISFNTMSVPGANSSTSISAVAIDANTARTALSSNTDNHTLYRYGNLFASSFLEGLGGAFQSANTSVTVGGTGGGDNITIENGVGRSVLQNTVIALGDVGKAWGQVAQQNFNTPTTVQVYSGTGVGVLFTQDLTKL